MENNFNPFDNFDREITPIPTKNIKKIYNSEIRETFNPKVKKTYNPEITKKYFNNQSNNKSSIENIIKNTNLSDEKMVENNETKFVWDEIDHCLRSNT